MSCYLLIRDCKTGEAIGLITCDYDESVNNDCIEDDFDDDRLYRFELENIEEVEYETYKALKLFKEYTRKTLDELVPAE